MKPRAQDQGNASKNVVYVRYTRVLRWFNPGQTLHLKHLFTDRKLGVMKIRSQCPLNQSHPAEFWLCAIPHVEPDYAKDGLSTQNVAVYGVMRSSVRVRLTSSKNTELLFPQSVNMPEDVGRISLALAQPQISILFLMQRCRVGLDTESYRSTSWQPQAEGNGECLSPDQDRGCGAGRYREESCKWDAYPRSAIIKTWMRAPEVRDS
ncbi:hypothetical protein EV426DRAFT_154844 [Tirmania nivea]|nr:hypothetical protein EV426DRAFT_154844 [Tirmania nivea]